jgi:hypothetical protein
MAPEIAHGRYGREVDVYAVAVMLFEMLTGKVPFDGETTGEILMKQLTEKPDLKSLPGRMQPVLARALVKDPLKRTPTVKQLAEEFETALHSTGNSTEIGTSENATVSEKSSAGNATQHNPRADSHPYRRSVTSTWKKLESVNWYNDPLRWGMLLLGGVLLLLLLSVFSKIAFPLFLIALPLVGFAAVCTLTIGVGNLVYRAFQHDKRGATASYRPGREPRRAIKTNTGYVRYLSPETTRHIGMLQRAAELTGSMSVAALCGAMIAFPLFLADYLPAPNAVFFGTVTTMTAWAAMLPAKMWEGRSGHGTFRRLMTGLLGCLVGVAAFQLDRALLLDLNVNDYSHISPQLGNLFETLGLSSSEGSRLTGYVMFFGMLLLARRWWFHVDSYRPRRVRILSVLWTAVTAMLITTIPKFPHELAILIATAASATAQASAVWQEPEQRNTGSSSPGLNPDPVTA